MKNVTITEIRAHLKAKGATLKKLKMRLNGNDVYKVEKDGCFQSYTASKLKEAYQMGAF